MFAIYYATNFVVHVCLSFSLNVSPFFSSGAVVILALQVLTPLCYYIPKSALSAVIISAVLQMVDYKIVMKLWKVGSEYILAGYIENSKSVHSITHTDACSVTGSCCNNDRNNNRNSLEAMKKGTEYHLGEITLNIQRIWTVMGHPKKLL